MDNDKNEYAELTLNGKPVTAEKLEEQKKLAEKTGAKLTESKPGQFTLHLQE
jgi:hypothetical protein